MIVSTAINRLSDKLPLTAYTDDTLSASEISKYIAEQKDLIRKLNASSEPRASIESGPYTHHYLISDGVIFITFCDKSYPRKLAFTYLDELSREFINSYGRNIEQPDLRPFAYITFENFIQKTRRVYEDTRTNVNLDKLNAELQDVTRVMTKNIEDLLYRGDSLDRMSDMSSSLRAESSKYRKAAKKINFDAMIRQYAPVAGAGLIFVFLIWWLFLR
ncbi:Longin-like domain-containing protein [Lipomyces oligophaga]|uniref:Longin-like domain-containing protein n=1 Tax=Lipomyces oligophaga TaxID=45792 RepID=UPI0034CD0320